MKRLGHHQFQTGLPHAFLMVVVLAAVCVLGSGLAAALDVPALKARVNDYAGLLTPTTLNQHCCPVWTR